jgi:cytochrome c-type biogenesis protein CcmH/NrfG
MRSPLLPPESNLQSLEELWAIVDLYLNLGKFNQSLQLAYRLLQRDANQQSRYLNHQQRCMRSGAEFAEEIGDHHRAAYYWEQVLQQQPQDANAWYGLGLAKANVQDFGGAQIALSRALQWEPNNSKIRSHLIEIEQFLQG